MPSRDRRAARHTVLLVGEGKTECAFLSHIKCLFISRGCGVSVKIRNAQGGGPDQMVDYAIKQRRNAAYDRAAVLLDTHLEMSVAARKRAKSKKIQIIGSTPCVEGLLLRILDEPVPDTCAECKARMDRLRLGPLTMQNSYQERFPRDVLEGRQHAVAELRELLGLFSFDD